MADLNLKKLQTRIALKYDTYTSWTTAPGKDVVLLKGELGICEIPSPNNDTKVAPTVLFKVGDGVKTYEALPWASAKAADVNAWAKKPSPDWTDFPALPIEIVDPGASTGKFITGITYANNKITITRSDVAWGDVTGKPDFVNSVKTTDDNIVILTPESAATGDVTITGAHKQYNKAGNTTDVDSSAITAGSTATIKVPKITVDAYGHTTFDGETSHTITIPEEAVVNDGKLTTEGDDYISVTGNFSANQAGDSVIKVSHKNSGVNAGTYGGANSISVGAGEVAEISIPALDIDEKGHVTAGDDYNLIISIPSIPTNHVTTDTKQEITADKEFINGAKISVGITPGEYGGMDGTTITANGIGVSKQTSTEGDSVGASMSIDGTISVWDDHGSAILSSRGIETAHGYLSFPTLPDEETGEIGGDVIATLSDVRSMVAGAVDYLGTVASEVALSALTDPETAPNGKVAGYGDFVRVTTGFGTYHAGDLLVYEQDGTWSVIHGEEGDITEVKGANGLTGGGSVGSVTISHGAKPTAGTAHVETAGTGRTYITKVDVDTYGHIAKVYTATETDQDLTHDHDEQYKQLQTEVTNKITDKAHVIRSLSQNENGDINYTVEKLTPGDIGAAVAQDITNAINELDVTNITGMGAGKTIKTLTETDGKIAATFEDISIVHTQVSDFDTATNALIDAKIQGLDSSVAATTVSDGSVNVLTGVTETDGKLTAKTEVNLKKVATTGSIYDIAEGSNTTSGGVNYLVFDCGSATVLV